ncbi:hypothetical protein IC762_31340 [Bradyrhizobium genosp. L]|uniref:hypothetical protein n=1 Tax=Bradyrhizobium genosp. L TaxID=83637 RepID=UPI0018A302D9|nr:hypothetical protein [Bradyrhizobium genosp. L]QPF84077.1 hypothetical protein IC762_31340 [Bradyrhizobium genosp. L]
MTKSERDADVQSQLAAAQQALGVNAEFAQSCDAKFLGAGRRDTDSPVIHEWFQDWSRFHKGPAL